ncbi:formylglycine-generating enzyme family protein [Granulicella cerasi]|uniref:formylglycine-generating enzyme family protein n=1 Tax=Granulicella cerasi TaxID=741063 RepID=UPI0021DFE2EE|nr:formylglycine-generating enzyme family protein [Granulicella cerasi]
MYESTENEPLKIVKKGCCTPSSERTEVTAAPKVLIAAERSQEERLADMVFLPGGTFLMGTDYAQGFAADGEGPVHAVTLDPFYMDRHTVTNAEFARFVDATQYKTEAEHFGWSFVFWSHVPKRRFTELVRDTVASAPWWCVVPEATWRSPEGPGSDIASRADYPVVHVSWNDAQAYCAWAGKSLPTEAQWEYAARGGLEQKLYPWGDQLRVNGEHRCNIWQGEFPREDTADDGYAGTCPVEAFPPNGYGIYSMTGNTWEWCADWFAIDAHATSVERNPQGPTSGSGRVMKGGSFLCHYSYCNRYRVAARTQNTPDSATGHMSFRCVVNGVSPQAE